MMHMARRLPLFLLWLGVWLLLTWKLDPANIATGAIVSLIVCGMTCDLLIIPGGGNKNPGRFLWFLYYIAVFLWECVKANVDVAMRVVHPSLPIRPCTVKVKTSLKSDAGLTFLANSITLTPGTTTIDIDRDKGYIYIHKLYVKENTDPHISASAIVEKFERILRRIFE